MPTMKGGDAMGLQFETFGNAIVQFTQDEKTILTTDPWITGTCYFGSWGLERPLTERQTQRVLDSQFVWISHGHPDHLHHESLALLSREQTRILLPDHYDREIHDSLASMGFQVTILPFKTWFQLDDGVRVMCLGNENQDGILIVEAGDALVINLNDSPLCGEGYFLQELIRAHKDPRKVILLGLCSIDADMLNIVDESGKSLAGDPDARKAGAIWEVAGKAADLGGAYWCCSSSQHKYVREDSVWANPYRIGFADMSRHWIRPEVTLVEPYVTVDLHTCAIVRNEAESPVSLEPTVPEEDWKAGLTAAEWTRVEQFIRKFEIIQDRVDFVEFVVGGESRRIHLRPGNSAGNDAKNDRGIVFTVPRQSLLETVEYGYFDDLLIGNFMKTRLVNTKLYPDFSKQVAKIGGNAKVFTREQHRAYLKHYFRKSPRAFLGMRLAEAVRFTVMPLVRQASDSLGVKPLMKVLYRKYLRREPVVTPDLALSGWASSPPEE